MWFANSENPYDTMGILHNEGLDYIVRHASSAFYTNVEELPQLCAQFRIDRGDVPISMYTELRDFCTAFTQYLDTAQFTYWDSLVFTSIQRSFADTIEAVIDDTTLDRDQTIQRLMQIESDILNSSMTIDEKAWLLGPVAIAKYSTYYWSTLDPAQWPVGAAVLGKPAGTSKTNWKEIIKSDCIGYAEGMVSGFLLGLFEGAVGGSIGGPVGTVGGAAGGAIIGSIWGGGTGAVVESTKTYLGQKMNIGGTKGSRRK